MPTLTVKSGPASGRTLPIDGEVVIGREGADLTIDDAELSRRHVALRPSAGGVEIEDLGSLNGTVVNGRRIDAPVTVTSGATVEVGSSRIEIEVEIAAPDTTRVTGQPIVSVEQPTRARAVEPTPPSAETAPAPAAATPDPAAATPDPAAATPDPPPPPAAGGARSRVLVAGGVLVALAVVAVGVVLLTGGDSDETEARTLQASVTTLPLGDPASFQVSGVLAGKPLDKVAVVVSRRLGARPRRGGRAVPVRGFMLVTPSGGNFSLNFRGTLRLTRAGRERLRASGTATNGTRDFLGMKGTVRFSGGRSSARAGTARYSLRGKLEY